MHRRAFSDSLRCVNRVVIICTARIIFSEVDKCQSDPNTVIRQSDYRDQSVSVTRITIQIGARTHFCPLHPDSVHHENFTTSLMAGVCLWADITLQTLHGMVWYTRV